MSREIIHSLVLVLSIALAFIYPRTGLAEYDLQISAALFIIMEISKRVFIKRSSYTRLIESVVFTLITVGIVNSTGGLDSPFFFLIYFLLFSLALILEPVISTSATLCLMVFFILSMPPNQDLAAFLPIISMTFLTPFAMYMGKEHLEARKSREQNRKLDQDSKLFVSLMLKNHLKNIGDAVDNYVGDRQLDVIRKTVSRMEKLIDRYERDK